MPGADPFNISVCPVPPFSAVPTFSQHINDRISTPMGRNIQKRNRRGLYAFLRQQATRFALLSCMHS